MKLWTSRSAAADAPATEPERPQVSTPRASEQPPWLRVGAIAGAAFVFGVLWPKVVGWQLVPRPPADDDGPAASAESAEAPAAAKPANGAPPLAKTAAVAPPVAAQPVAPKVSLEPARVTACEGAGGKKPDSCDAIDFDKLAAPALAKLGSCAGAEHAEGSVSLGFKLDFAEKKLVSVVRGKSTTLERKVASEIADCAKQAVSALDLGTVAHQHERYTVFVKVVFAKGAPEVAAAGSGAPTEGAAPTEPVTPTSGKATVAWGTAIVRDTPSKTGNMAARLLSGTTVVVTGKTGDWYRVKYGPQGKEGWVFKSALGL